MGTIKGNFADLDPYVLTGQIQTANNNQSALNASIQENDQVRSTTAALHPSSLTINLTSNVPNVATTLQGTIGAALGSIGQEGTPSQEPGGGGNPCFIGLTQISTPDGVKPIRDIHLGEMVLGFNKAGARVPQKVIGKQEHLEQSYLLVEFEDGSSTGTTPGHKYWTRTEYEAIANLEAVWHWHKGWVMRRITGKKVMHGEVILYNMTVENTHNYIANGDAVSNLKPEPPFGG